MIRKPWTSQAMPARPSIAAMASKGGHLLSSSQIASTTAKIAHIEPMERSIPPGDDHYRDADAEDAVDAHQPRDVHEVVVR